MLTPPDRRTTRRPHRRPQRTISPTTLPCFHRNSSLSRRCDDRLNPPLVSPLIILLRNRRPRTLFILGGAMVLLSPLSAVLFQAALVGDGSGLGAFWSATGEMTSTAQAFIVVDFFSRAVGMMLLGLGLYRNGVITGDRSIGFYRWAAVVGLGVGLPLAAIGLAWVAADGFSPGVALIGTIPNTLGTVPAVIGYASLIILWNRRSETSLHRRLRSAGRMALTNYLTQTVLGILILRWILADKTLTRTMLVGFVMVVPCLAWPFPLRSRRMAMEGRYLLAPSALAMVGPARWRAD